MPRNRKNRTKKRRGRGGRVARLPKMMVWNGSGGKFMPPIFQTRLRFHKTVSFSQNTIASTSVRYKPTFAYDVDPNLGSTSMPGFSELTALYGGYRVLGYRYDLLMINQEAFDVTGYVLTLAADPGANCNVADATKYLSNPNAKKVELARAGSVSKGRISGRESVARYAGQTWPGIFDPYSGAGTGAPQDILYLHVGAVPTNATSTFTTSTGVAISITINVTIAFFTVTAPPTISPQELERRRLSKNPQNS